MGLLDLIAKPFKRTSGAKRLSSGSGYLEIDHRNSPGLTAADVAHMPRAIPVPGGKRFESDVYNCGHCSRQVLLTAVNKPITRRGVCLKCYHYICEFCRKMHEATGECHSVARLFDRLGEQAVKFEGQPDHPDAVMSPEAMAAKPSPRIVLTDA